MTSIGSVRCSPTTRPNTVCIPIAAQPPQLLDQLPGFGAALADVEAEGAGLLDRVVVPPFGVAEAAEELELLGNLRSRAQVAGIGVTGH